VLPPNDPRGQAESLPARAFVEVLHTLRR